jgi:hypothetical protein
MTPLLVSLSYSKELGLLFRFVQEIIISRCIIVPLCERFATISEFTFSCYKSWIDPDTRCLYSRYIIRVFIPLVEAGQNKSSIAL